MERREMAGTSDAKSTLVNVAGARSQFCRPPCFLHDIVSRI
jgi:hypothetical protein